jgi:hypothetical protein
MKTTSMKLADRRTTDISLDLCCRACCSCLYPCLAHARDPCRSHEATSHWDRRFRLSPFETCRYNGGHKGVCSEATMALAMCLRSANDVTDSRSQMRFVLLSPIDTLHPPLPGMSAFGTCQHGVHCPVYSRLYSSAESSASSPEISVFSCPARAIRAASSKSSVSETALGY